MFLLLRLPELLWQAPIAVINCHLFQITTNLAPIASESNLFDHIKHMLWTTTPAWLIGLFIYFLLGLGAEGSVDLCDHGRFTFSVQV
jgi:hypothetical protein